MLRMNRRNLGGVREFGDQHAVAQRSDLDSDTLKLTYIEHRVDRTGAS